MNFGSFLGFSIYPAGFDNSLNICLKSNGSLCILSCDIIGFSSFFISTIDLTFSFFRDKGLCSLQLSH